MIVATVVITIIVTIVICACYKATSIERKNTNIKDINKSKNSK